MKTIILALLTLSSAFAGFNEVSITLSNNAKGTEVSLGYFKDKKGLMLTKDGIKWGVKGSEFTVIDQGTKNLELGEGVIEDISLNDFQDKGSYIIMVYDKRTGDEYQYDIAACDLLDSDQKHYYPHLGTNIVIDAEHKRAFCVYMNEEVAISVTMADPGFRRY